MTRENHTGASTPLVALTTSSLFVFIAATENRPPCSITITATMGKENHRCIS